jgi:intein/homing endonuclease
VRSAHVTLDGQRRAIGGTFEVSGQTAKAPGGFGDPALDANCLPPGQEVRGRFVAGARSFYEGPVIEVTTQQGHFLRVTPNHPVMTPRGLVPAGSLNAGDEVLCYIGGADTLVPERNDDHGPATIDEVYRAIKEVGTSVSTRIGPEHLHGDGRFVTAEHREIDVVLACGQLGHDTIKAGREDESDLGLMSVDVGANALPRGGSQVALPHTDIATPGGIMGSGDLHSSLVGRHHGPLKPLGFGSTPSLDASLRQTAIYNGSGDAESLSERQLGLSGDVAFDKIVSVNVDALTCHVYDLQSTTGLMVAGGIVISNCRCTILPVLED